MQTSAAAKRPNFGALLCHHLAAMATQSTSGSVLVAPELAPNIYCINLASSKARRSRMERRLAHHDLLGRTHFVSAIAATASTDPNDDWKDRASAACSASHLKAMRAILSDPHAAKHGAIICEDDVLLHNDFAARLGDVLENLPADAPFCSLGYLISSWEAGLRWAGRHPRRRNVCKMLPPAIWGTHGYWISCEYARAVLSRYEQPGAEIPSLTERIAHESDGYIAYPPLVLQDVIDSTIRGPEELDFHRSSQLAWAYEDYSACEEGHHESPLREVQRRQQSIALCMIVKDEAAIIERCLWSARPLIDSWVICDTGSDDNTSELVEEVLGDLPGILHRGSRRDFGSSWSELMELARGTADYLLLVDADMTIELERPLPPLSADAYLIRHAASLDCAVPRLVRGDRRWWFEGSTQEHLATEQSYTQQTLDELVVKRHADGVNPSEKFERGEIIIYTGPGWETWSPMDIETRGLGGSETAAVRLAEQLSRLGYAVTVYGEFEQCVHRDVIFRHWSTFDPTQRHLAFICSRIPEIFDRQIAAQSRLLWMHDTDYRSRLTEQRAQAIDHVLTLSGWHTEHVASIYPFLRPKLRQIRNGIEHGYFTGEPQPRAVRVVCSSAPDRGLGVLLELWPQILAEVPDAELAYCYYAVYDAVAEQQPQVAAHLAEIRALAAQPGVAYLGSLTQPQVAELMRSSLVWAHPSYSTLFACPFVETSCIGAVEAQAAGCLAVTSQWGALSETVEIGRVVDGEPLSERWRTGFVEAIVEGLTAPDVQAWAQREGPKAVAAYSWRSVAEQVAGLIDAGVVPSARAVTRANGRQTIGLAMIVRDEAAVIERCLASVMPLIDHWTICDTGSKDRTAELIETSLSSLPGRLYHDDWRDFAHNRTLLMERAAGTADYLLLIDADMTVQPPDTLPSLTADAYLLRHGGDIDYVIPRLVRGDRKWRFEGPTHEYLATEGPMQSEILEALLIEHHGDGGMRREKLERDAQLLEARLDADPDDARSVFYLAQTERDRGNVRRAIELYARRVELDGWDEEVFYAAYQHGVLLAHADPDAAVPLLLAAFEKRPTRAEPLYELARLSRAAERYEAAHMFATRGLELPYPQDWLFVHRDVYRWGLLFELSIAAYWVGRPGQALEANDRLLEAGGLPEEIEASVRENQRHCLAAVGRARANGASATNSPEPLSALVPGTELGEIRLEIDPDWPCFNPSIAPDGDGYRLVVRTANYRIEGGRQVFLGDDRVTRTINYVVLLDGALGLTDVAPLVDRSAGPGAHPPPILGFENCRLFQVGGEWHAIATVRDHNPQAVCEVALLAIDGADIASVLALPEPEPGRHETNWMPLVVEDRLHFVYSCSPTVVLGCDPSTGLVEPAARYDEAPGWAVGFRGGSQGLAVDDGYLFVTHEVREERHERTYTHRLVLLDHDLRLSAASPQFSFMEQSMELCAGLARRGGELVMSFGAGDRAACLAVCPEDALTGLLEPLGSFRIAR